MNKVAPRVHLHPVNLQAKIEVNPSFRFPLKHFFGAHFLIIKVLVEDTKCRAGWGADAHIRLLTLHPSPGFRTVCRPPEIPPAALGVPSQIKGGPRNQLRCLEMFCYSGRRVHLGDALTRSILCPARCHHQPGCESGSSRRRYGDGLQQGTSDPGSRGHRWQRRNGSFDAAGLEIFCV